MGFLGCSGFLRGIRVWLPGLVTVAGLLAAAPAQAAVAYTGDAATGSTTATAYGYVTAQGEKTVWAFAYGPTTKYGSWSKTGTVNSGDDNVLVAAPLGNLQSGTTYHYLLVAVPYDSSGNIDWGHVSYGQDATFTTSRGSLTLLSSRLTVKRGAVSLPLQCASTLRCTGSVRLDAQSGAGRSLKKTQCATQRVSLVGGAKATYGPRLSSGCARLIRSARGHRLSVTDTGRVSSGQSAPDQKVTLQG